jgi:hypothetical protein
MTRQGLETLNQALQARKQAEVEGQEVEFTPPSEAEFAVAVAKDMAAEIFSPENRVVWLTVVVAIIAMSVGFLLGRMSGAEKR